MGKLNKKNINFEKIEDILYVMRRPHRDVNYVSADEEMSLLKEAEQKAVVHLYPADSSRGQENCLLHMRRWGYHQIYLAVKDSELYSCFGHGQSSGGREMHNRCLDAVVADEELQQIPTTVLVTYKKRVISHYCHDSFAFANHDIDMNWHKGLRMLLNETGLPFSYHRSIDDSNEVLFVNGGDEFLVYRAVSIDTVTKRFRAEMSGLP